MTDNHIDAEIARLGTTLSVQEGQVPALERLTKNPITVEMARYKFTWVIIWAFVLYAAAIGLYVMANGEMTRAAVLLEVLKSIFFPVLTLMLGHYFGKSSS